MPEPAQKTSPKNIVSFKPDSSKENTPQESFTNSYLNDLIQQHEVRVLRLKGYLEDAEQRYSRLDKESSQKIKDLETEVTELHRKLREDNSDLKLTHQKEINDLEKAHRNVLDEKNAEISRLERKIEIETLKQEFGGKRGVGDRVMDMFEENGGEFISNLITGLNKIAQNQGVPPQQLSGEQFNQAFNQAQQKTHHQPANARQPESGIQNPEPSNQNPQPGKPLTEDEKEQVKEQVKNFLLEQAMQALSNKNSNLGDYAATVHKQLELNKQNGIQLDANQWVHMAHSIAEKAIELEVSPERVASIIRPALDNVEKGKSALKYMPAKNAADMLFDLFSIETSPAVKKLVTNVLEGFKQNL